MCLACCVVDVDDGVIEMGVVVRRRVRVEVGGGVNVVAGAVAVGVRLRCESVGD